MSPKNKATKKTIYVDVDEEITGIIDKVRSAEESIVALVVPKRAAVFASIVNLKLLKRSADQSKKKVVLITANQSVLPLAGIVGLHVSSNLTSKPYIPKSPDSSDAGDDNDSDEAIEIDSATAATAAVVGAGAIASANDEMPSIAVEKTTKDVATKNVATKVKKDKKPKLKVPNFKKFRTLLIAGVVALLLIGIGGYWALAIAPKATVTLRGENNNESLAFKFSADTEAKELKQEEAILPAKNKEIKKTESEKVAATGEKNNGNKASGTVTLQNCSKSEGRVEIPAGTGISSGELTYVTQQAISLKRSSFIFAGGNFVCDSDSEDVDVIAQEGGEKYNIDSGEDFAVAGYSGVSGTGSSMTGGTDEIVKVVSQSDIDKAKSALANKTVGATEELKAALKADGYIALTDTLNAETGQYIASPKVDTESSDVTVSVQVTYSMLGIKKDDLQTLIKFKAEKDGKIDTSKQSILDDGLGSATYQLGANSDNVTEVNISSKIVVGPEIDQTAIKNEIAGKKRGIAEQTIADRPGIKEVKIETKPFWNFSVPKNINKITITVDETSDEQPAP